MNEWYMYRKSAVAEIIKWTPDFDMTGVSVDDKLRAEGHPKDGDRVVRDVFNHADKWLITEEFFRKNYVPA